MERARAIDQDAISAAVARVAAQRRDRHRARRLGVTEGYLAEAVVALPDGVRQAEQGATPSGWLPCGVVFDGVIGEELRVWLRPKDGRVVAEVALDPPEQSPRQIVYPDANPDGIRRDW
jgi:hypothetical protein